MSSKSKIDKNTISLAICIAVFPPIWAVLAPYIGIQTGAVALICAGVYVSAGNKIQNALKISIGFLLGDFWAWLVIKIINAIDLNPDFELYMALFVLGGLAVFISALLERWIFCPAWLCGWAIGLTIMAPMGADKIGNYPIQIAVAMIVGVWYIGIFLDIVQRKIIEVSNIHKNKED